MKQKTAMMEYISDVKEYVKSLNTLDNYIYRKNELLILECFFKAIELAEEKLEKEKEQIIDAANNGCNGGMCYIDSERDGINYYNETYKQD